MMGIFKKMSLAPKGLRYKLIMAFSLMSIIPILACAYIIFSYSFPTATELINILTLAISSKLGITALKNTIFAHPTLAEAIQEAAYGNKDI